METVIVTGACGFVGNNLIRALANKRENVIGVDIRLSKKKHNFRNSNRIKIIKLDFTKKADLNCLLQQIKDKCYLIHLGGYILQGVKKLKGYDVERSVKTNVIGSYNLIKALKPKLTGVCLASTLDVYGTPKSLPITEEHPALPETFYSASKLAMEVYAKIELGEKIPLTILRFSHIYGNNDPHPKVLQILIKNVQLNQNPVIYGDGKDLRDFVHVDDVIQVINKAIDIKPNGVFNIATGKSIALKQLAELIIKISQKKIEPIFKERMFPRKDFCFDIRKMIRELGYSPRIGIAEGIKEIMNAK